MINRSLNQALFMNRSLNPSPVNFVPKISYCINRSDFFSVILCAIPSFFMKNILLRFWPIFLIDTAQIEKKNECTP